MKLFKNVLYYPGCMYKFVLKDLGKKYEEILKKCGIDFIKLKGLEVCCGSPVLNAGYFKNFELLVKNNLRVFKEHSIKKVITPCPACFKTFKIEYPKFVTLDFEIEHVTQTIWNAIKNGKLKLDEVKKPLKATFHDPCHLGRYCEVYDEPRKILESFRYDIVEMEFSRENAFCCGGGAGLKSNYPDLVKEIARDRIKQALKTKAKFLITACPMCYVCLKEVADKKIEVVEFSSLFK
ncbi:MAG: (Fe-S)-binding protein [Candidatus Aenigmarchaeota archaeon]|nr:(Fe-S)-binding protein [Candidatus Aenigmarchaeota archaeon]